MKGTGTASLCFRSRFRAGLLRPCPVFSQLAKQNAGCVKLPAFFFAMLLFDVPSGPFGGDISWLWFFLPVGYAVTVLIEAPVLFFLLPKIFSAKARLLSGLWLTACTYPVVVLVLPALMFGSSRIAYLAVAEIFAPLAECILFWLAFRGTQGITSGNWIRSFAVITVANLISFGIGEVLNYTVWYGLF